MQSHPQRETSRLKTLWHRLGSPRWFYEISGPWIWVFGMLALVLLVTGTVWGLAFAPPDYLQGNSFRIIYVHVPAAIVAQSAYMLMGAAGVLLLVWRMKLADMVLATVVPFGMSMTALALFTGAVWGKPTWGAWWVWDARLTSELVLLFLYIGFMALHAAIDDARRADRSAALLAIVGVVNVPIIYFSVKWWNTLHQGASVSVTSAPSMAPPMLIGMLVMALAFWAYCIAVGFARLRIIIVERERHTAWVRKVLGVV